MFDLRVEGSVARLTLRRPEARNAIPLEGWSRLASVAEQALSDGARVLILSGEPGGAFCAGADISEFGRFAADPGARSAFRLAMRDGLDRLAGLALPSIALVEGACFGAGVALAMACDIRIAGSGARFAITPAKLGISYPQEDVHRLISLVGPGQAARLLFSAQAIDAGEAARIGLVEIHEDAAPETASALAESIAANDRDSLEALKRSIRLGVREDRAQDEAFDDLLGSEALLRGLASHRERRR